MVGCRVCTKRRCNSWEGEERRKQVRFGTSSWILVGWMVEKSLLGSAFEFLGCVKFTRIGSHSIIINLLWLFLFGCRGRPPL